MTITFDDSALRAHVDPTLARQESRERVAREGRRFGVALGSGWIVFQSIVLVAGAGVLAALAVVAVQFMFGADGADLTTIVLAVLMVLPLAIVRIRSHLRGPRDREIEEYRLSRFAETNGLAYRTGELDPERPAALFGIGTSRIASDIMAGPEPRPFEAADYSFDTWVARARMPRTANYVSFALQSPLPAMTLVTKAQGVAASGWDPVAPQEQVAFEGEFASRYDVYTARATEEPVRHLLSPEVQSALVGIAERSDIEIVGDRLYVVSRRHLPMSEPAYWEWVTDLAALVTLLEARGRAEHTDGIRDADAARRTRRDALFAAPQGGRAAAMGCLVPLLVGLAAAAVITKMTTG